MECEPKGMHTEDCNNLQDLAELAEALLDETNVVVENVEALVAKVEEFMSVVVQNSEFENTRNDDSYDKGLVKERPLFILTSNTLDAIGTCLGFLGEEQAHLIDACGLARQRIIALKSKYNC